MTLTTATTLATTMADGAPRSHDTSRVLALQRHGVDVLLDVGADAGRFATLLRATGYRGRIVSVEPLDAAYAELSLASAVDPAWTAVQAALAATPGPLDMHVTADSRCSSVLTPAAIVALPGGVPVSTATVSSRTLDELCDEHVGATEHLAVKLDAQGYEREILAGGAVALVRARVLELEMALVATYDGAALVQDLLPALTAHGFAVVSIEPGHRDRTTGQVYDVDVLMERTA